MSIPTISPTMRRRLAMQGFAGFVDAALAQIGPWLLVAPAVCSVLTAVGTLLAMQNMLWALMPFGMMCAIRGAHPFDLIYNLGFRHVLGTPRLPRYRAPRRFAWLRRQRISFFFGSPSTKRKIFLRKLEVANCTQAIVRAQELGLLPT